MFVKEVSLGLTGFIFCENEIEQKKFLSSMNKTIKYYNMKRITLVNVEGRNNGFFTQS